MLPFIVVVDLLVSTQLAKKNYSLACPKAYVKVILNP